MSSPVAETELQVFLQDSPSNVRHVRISLRKSGSMPFLFSLLLISYETQGLLKKVMVSEKPQEQKFRVSWLAVKYKKMAE